MIQIRSQVYRRRIDRNSPSGRSAEWVATVSQPVRQLTPEQVRDWESIVRSVAQRQQSTTS
jgi:hypothetical protein